MCFGMTGLLAGGRDEEHVPKRPGGTMTHDPKVTDQGKRLNSLMRLARQEAKRRGLTLKQYLTIPRDQRPI